MYRQVYVQSCIVSSSFHEDFVLLCFPETSPFFAAESLSLIWDFVVVVCFFPFFFTFFKVKMTRMCAHAVQKKLVD